MTETIVWISLGIAISSFVGTIVFSIINLIIARQTLHTRFKPNLTLIEIDDDTPYSYRIYNLGYGPAIKPRVELIFLSETSSSENPEKIEIIIKADIPNIGINNYLTLDVTKTIEKKIESLDLPYRDSPFILKQVKFSFKVVNPK